MSRKKLGAHLFNNLRKEKHSSKEQSFEPMSQYELYKRIDKSESDFRNDRFKESADLLAKYDK